MPLANARVVAVLFVFQGAQRDLLGMPLEATMDFLWFVVSGGLGMYLFRLRVQA